MSKFSTGDLLKYIQFAGVLLSATDLILEDGIAIVEKIMAVKEKGTVTDKDWEDLHVYEKKETDILDAPMEGENAGTGDETSDEESTSG